MTVARFLWSLMIACVGAGMGSAHAPAAEVRVAVAANFAEPAKALATQFERRTGHTAILSFGATGQLFAQITQGAPFDVFLAADAATPARAIAEGHAVAGTALTYATGRLVLYSTTLPAPLGADTLRRGTFLKLAIANPATAPYGAAAIETLRTLGALDATAARLVQGQSIAQTFQFIDSGNADVGFVALAQVIAGARGSYWLVPQTLHSPIFQDAVLLNRGRDNAAAAAFLGILRSPEARQVIERFGYGQGD